MTTTAGDLDFEVLLLDAWLDDTPRCEVIWRNMLTGLEHQCHRPAGVRLRVNCDGCGRVITHFFCAPCWDDVKAGRTECSACGSGVTIAAQL